MSLSTLIQTFSTYKVQITIIMPWFALLPQPFFITSYLSFKGIAFVLLSYQQILTCEINFRPYNLVLCQEPLYLSYSSFPVYISWLFHNFFSISFGFYWLLFCVLITYFLTLREAFWVHFLTYISESSPPCLPHMIYGIHVSCICSKLAS
jgi:hypothetical protein